MSPAEITLRNCEALIIEDHETAELAASDLRAIAARRKALEEQRLEITRPIDASKERVMNLFRPAQMRLAQAEDVVRTKLNAWLKKVEEERVAAQRRIEAEQREARQRAEQEAARAQAEADEKERKLREDAEAARAAGDERRAQRLEGRANAVVETTQAKVLELHQAATTMLAAPIVAPAPKLKGISSPKKYGGECIDFDALLEFVASPAGKVFRGLVKLDQSALDAQARAQKEHFAIPGCQLVDRGNLAVRTK